MPSTDGPDFRVVRTEIDDDGNFFPVVEFGAADGKPRTHRVPMGLLTQPCKAATSFADKGALVPPNMPEVVARLRAEVPDSPKQRVTKRGGWIGDDFVTSRLSLAKMTGTVSFDQSDSSYQSRTRSGYFPKFKKGIAHFLGRSDFLVFAYLVGLTPPLAARIGRTESFAVAFRQESSTGKTLCLRLAQSLYAKAEEVDLWSFSDTQGILRDSLPAMGGLCAPFRDIKTALNLREAAQKIHDLIFPARRLRKGDTLPLQPQFFIPMLSAEQSIRDFLKCHGAPAEDGEAVRLLEIPVPNRAQGGIFAGAVNSAALAQELADFMKAQHGTVLYQWIRKLQKSDPSALDDSARQQEQSFLDSLGNLPHHHTRFAKHFALIAATAYLATHEKIIPVKHDRCLGAVRRMFRLAVSEMAHSAEEQQSCWRDFFALCKDRRLFPLVSIGNSVGDEALGFVRRKERREIIYLPQSALVSKFGDAFVTRVLIPRLREAQLVPASGETTRPVSQAGLPRGRYLSFDVTKLRALKGQVLSLPGERPDR